MTDNSFLEKLDVTPLVEKVVLTLVTWAEDFFALLPNLAVAALVFALAWLFGRLLQRAFSSALKSLGADNVQVVDLLAGLLRITVVCIGLFIALGILHLDKTVTSLLAGVGVIGIGLGFALQDLTANFMAGIMMSIRRYPFVNGDLIETNSVMGVVEKLDLRSTSVRKMTGELVIVPNKDIFQKPLTNFSESGQRRVDLEVGVAYREDLERVRDIAMRAGTGVKERLPDREVEVFFTEFADSAVTFVVRMWVAYPQHVEFMRSRSELIIAIKKAFDAEDIKIPFPIRTLEFGDVGGERLSDMLLHAKRDRASDAGAPI
jgi:small conductance mechanosensitive channel